MITRPPTRPQSLLRAIVKQSQSPLTRSQCRRQHTASEFNLRKIPKWQDQAKPEVFQKYGIPGFLSQNTFEQTFHKYIDHLCGRLNEWTAGTNDEGLSSYELHLRYAHTPQKAALYNHAAMATHTHMFFESLAHIPAGELPRTPGINMKRSIDENFGTIDQLRTEFLEVADSVFGNGFVWLMLFNGAIDKSRGSLGILATYNSGSPWPGAAPRRDNREMANFDARTLASQLSNRRSIPEYDKSPGGGQAGHFGNNSANAARFYEGHLTAEPLLCVNLWQHQWLPDYGMYGRRDYLKAWWDTIDWGVVEHRYSLAPPVQDYESRLRGNRYASVMNGLQERDIDQINYGL